MIKIIFFDIDGTLIHFGSKQMTFPVQQALNKLQENGIKIFIATGRPNYKIPSFEGVTFDGALSFNGQYCFDKQGDIFHNPLDADDIQTLIKNCKEIDEPVCLASKEKLGCNFKKEMLDKYFTDNSQDCPVLSDFERHSKQPIYQAMVGVTEEYDEQILKNTSHIKATRWWPFACDVIPAIGGKDLGIQKVLEYYGYSNDECMAFGDGGNDKTMLECAGIGVAMGNAIDEVKAIANYVTDDVTEDGVVSALQHFNLI